MNIKSREVKFLVEGLSCTGCAEDMENVMRGMNGVENARLNYKDSIFSITYDPDEIGEKTILKKVKTLGFKTNLLPG